MNYEKLYLKLIEKGFQEKPADGYYERHHNQNHCKPAETNALC